MSPGENQLFLCRVGKWPASRLAPISMQSRLRTDEFQGLRGLLQISGEMRNGELA